MKECPPDKELNPKTNRCVKKCDEGYERNDNFKCVKIRNIPRQGITELRPIEATINTPNPVAQALLGSLASTQNTIIDNVENNEQQPSVKGKSVTLPPEVTTAKNSTITKTAKTTKKRTPKIKVHTPLQDTSMKLEIQNNEEIRFDELQKIDDQYLYNTQMSAHIREEDIPETTDNSKGTIKIQLGTLPDNVESKEYNKFLNTKEKEEFDNNNAPEELYPTLNDPNFSSKIAYKQEFQETKYDGSIQNIREQAEKYCNATFELNPNQIFIKNFLSNETPYNSLLLFHGVGTGKTCSAIGVSEEIRSFNKQNKTTQRIIIVASPNVQDNFKLQLFDETKLELVGGFWNLKTCVGQSLIREINPTNMKDIPREVIVRQINNIIRTNYLFLGYTEFSRYMQKTVRVNNDTLSNKQRKMIEIEQIKKTFNNRLLIIDEAHNIRATEDNKKKLIGSLLLKIAKYSNNMKLMLLSGTPMYNSQNEIIWLANVLNNNDNRASIKQDEIFDKDGNFLEAADGKESGKELLTRKLIGYVSYIKGENPYAFPFRIYPDVFDPESKIENYPSVQFNDVEITNPLQHIPVYPSTMEGPQKEIYDKIISNTKDTHKVKIDNMQSFGYTLLQKPIEATIITYPGKNMVGKTGFSEIMEFTTLTKPMPLRKDYEYKFKEFQGFFKTKVLKDYSAKITKICNIIKNSKGIVMIYSQFIDSGIIPMALALEELGFSRYSSTNGVKSLFKNKPSEIIDANELVPKSEMLRPSKFKPAQYCIITGDSSLSHNNSKDLQYINQNANKNGELVKVYLISRAASEGLDFKNIRQVHILDPWYNMNRIEQIIGRAVRFKSHCLLPFEQRNVEIYLHAVVDEKETPDLYLYRLAETKSKQIGNVSRLMKEVSVDCQLNIGQTNFTAEKLQQVVENQNIEIELTNDTKVQFTPGDKPYTSTCDYMDNCEFVCYNKDGFDNSKIEKSTYNLNFIKMNYNEIVLRIKQIFKEDHILKQDNLIGKINVNKEYPTEQILYVLSEMIDHKSERLMDKYERPGYLVNKGDYYAFQPVEINDENISVLERITPIDFKHKNLIYPKGSVVENNDNIVVSAEIKDYVSIVKDIEKHLQNIEDKKFKEQSNVRKEKGVARSWYEHAATETVQSLIINEHKIPKESFIRYIVFHFIDELQHSEKLVIARHVHYQSETNFIDAIFKEYFEARTIVHKNKTGFVLYHQKKNKLYIIGENEIEEARQIDNQNFKIPIAEKFLKNRTVIYNEIGFLTPGKEISFKLKSIGQQYKNSGQKCSTANKQDIIYKLHCVMQGEYCKPPVLENMNENTHIYSDAEINNKLSKPGLCLIFEIILRYFSEIQYRNKTYFFNLEEAHINQVDKI